MRRVIDKRNKEKFQVDDAYLNGMAKICGWQGTIVYTSLCRHASKEQESFPSIRLMAEQHNVGRNTILKGIENLQSRNVISVEKTRSKLGKWLNNTYILLDKSEWDYTQVPVEDTAIQVLVETSPSPREIPSQVPVEDTNGTHIKETHRRKHINDFSSQKNISDSKKVKITGSVINEVPEHIQEFEKVQEVFKYYTKLPMEKALARGGSYDLNIQAVQRMCSVMGGISEVISALESCFMELDTDSKDVQYFPTFSNMVEFERKQQKIVSFFKRKKIRNKFE